MVEPAVVEQGRNTETIIHRFNVRRRSSVLAVFLLAAFLLTACSKKNEPLVLWTNKVEFVSYCELYNSLQNDVKIIPLYQKAHGQKIDIVAGSYIQSGIKEKKFAPLNSLIKGKGPLNKDDFYSALLKNGSLNERQYLLPVSFNLPALVFNTANYDAVREYNMLSWADIQTLSKKFNAQNKSGAYTAMGFGPLWSDDFLYLIFKTDGIFFDVQNDTILYSENAFKKTADEIDEWVRNVNGSAENEQDFAFKYLYMPFYNQVHSGRCLFSHATSTQIMALSGDQLSNLDFKWICNNGKIQAEDDAVMIGIDSKSRRKAEAKKFIVWLLNEDSQKKMLDRKFKMNLETATFGIAGGFSSLQNVNRRLFPLYYKALLSNVPDESSIAAPGTFSEDWAEIKEKVLLPFIADYMRKSGDAAKPLAERYAITGILWNRNN